MTFAIKLEMQPAQAYPMSDDYTAITAQLQEIADGRAPLESVVPFVYEQLRVIARNRMASERTGHTLQATALVHEVFVKLQADQKLSWENRSHFYAAAAEAMRRVLIDHARRRGRQKRGSGQQLSPLSVADLADRGDLAEVQAINDAIDRLESEDPKAAEVVRLRFYAGLSIEDVASALHTSERTVYREWTYAKTRLFEMLNEND